MMNDSTISKAVIEIDKQYGTKITIHRDGGIISSKSSTIENIQQVLLENFQFVTGWLPAGTRFYKKSNDMETVFIESPPTIRGVEYNRGDRHGRFVIPVPWTLWKFSLSSQQGKRYVAESAVWAMKMPITPGKERDHRIYAFPFSNVNSGGGICWGGGDDNSAVMSSLDSVGKLGRLIEQFWSAPFNGDLDGSHYTPFKNEQDVTITHCHSLLEHLNGKTAFPYEILVEYRTLGSFL